tara:strand:+ start:581 stop:868 length:288 start_codon:yes stop_codon:yes gene_type:complete
MTRYNCINGQNVQFTAEEEAARDIEEAAVLTAEPEEALNELRKKRNKLLSETDYLGASDNTMSSAMTTYRQALRDLPSGKDTVEKCKNATFPTKP